MKSVSGRPGCIARLWTQWPSGASGSGRNSERRPPVAMLHESPPSSVRKAPAAEIATNIRRVSAGSMRMVCRHIPPAPGCQSAPRPCERSAGSSATSPRRRSDPNSPASSTPAKTTSGSCGEGSRCHTRLNSHGCCVPSYQRWVPGSPAYRKSLPTGVQVAPPSSERWTTWPCQSVHDVAQSRSGSAGEPWTCMTVHPPKNGPATRQSRRAPSALSVNAPFLVPISRRTPATAPPGDPR